MNQRLKERFVDLLWVVLAASILLGGFYVFQRIRYHDALDQALLQLIQSQQRGAPARPPQPLQPKE